MIIILIMLIFFISTRDYEKFKVINKESHVTLSPELKFIIEATKECNKLEEYKDICYSQIANEAGEHYGNQICENLKEEEKSMCYGGYGISIGKKYGPNMETIKDECSKTMFYEDCLIRAAIVIVKESSKEIKPEQCEKFEQEDVKQRCYEEVGRQLANGDKEPSLCEEVKNKERCLVGFAYITDKKGDRKEALQICNKLNEDSAELCYFRIGENSVWIYNKSIEEAFKDCEQYSYKEYCKQGVVGESGVAIRFFEKNMKPSTS